MSKQNIVEFKAALIGITPKTTKAGSLEIKLLTSIDSKLGKSLLERFGYKVGVTIDLDDGQGKLFNDEEMEEGEDE